MVITRIYLVKIIFILTNFDQIFFAQADLRALLEGKLKPGVDVDSLCDGIEQLYINEEAHGGIYCLLITNPTFVYKTGEKEADMSLLKFGRTDNYASRYSQFSFKYEVLFEINGDNNMEAWLKENLPANVKKEFWPGAAVLTIKGYLKLPASSNPAPSEWRIVSNDLVKQIRDLELTSLNYRTKFTTMISGITPRDVASQDLTLQWGDYTRKNVGIVRYW